MHMQIDISRNDSRNSWNMLILTFKRHSRFSDTDHTFEITEQNATEGEEGKINIYPWKLSRIIYMD